MVVRDLKTIFKTVIASKMSIIKSLNVHSLTSLLIKLFLAQPIGL